jgi:hypothetical protein
MQQTLMLLMLPLQFRLLEFLVCLAKLLALWLEIVGLLTKYQKN